MSVTIMKYKLIFKTVIFGLKKRLAIKFCIYNNDAYIFCANVVGHNKYDERCHEDLVSFCMVFPLIRDNFCRKHCLMTSLIV